MDSKSQTVLTVQLSIIGIIVVIGLYLLWRQQQRMEQKLKSMHETMTDIRTQQIKSLNSLTSNSAPSMPMNMPSFKLPVTPDQLMNEMGMLFGNDFNVFSNDDDHDHDENDENASEEINDTGVRITEIDSHPHPAKHSPSQPTQPHKLNVEIEVENETDEEGEVDDVSDAGTTSKPLSKGNLLKKNVETLREILRSKNLPTDGVKKELIARLIQNSK